MAELEDRRVRTAARILNRTADQSRFRRETDGFRRNFRRVAKALFQVRRDGQIGGIADHPSLRQRLLTRDPAVAATQQTRGRAARGRQRGKSQRGHHPCRAEIGRAHV